jgi:glucose-6-phosphate 1-dehydrogenase
MTQATASLADDGAPTRRGARRGSPMIERLVVFGATGDLTGRYLLPALAWLQAAGSLPRGFQIVGAAYEDYDDHTFRRSASEHLERFAPGVPGPARKSLLRSLSYRQVDVTDPRSVAHAVGNRASDSGPVAAYLALPPGLFPATVTALGELGLPEGSRIALEKPFGEDLKSAAVLNLLLAQVSGVGGEQAVFRVDHFLALETVENLLGARLGNRVLEPVWNSAHIEQIDIVWEETLALEGRARYYDGAGQLKDMVPNHLMQVLCLAAMEPPSGLTERELRDRKLDVLRSVRPLTPADVVSRTARGRYTAGTIGDRLIPAYVDEEGVESDRNTESFAEILLELDSWRWQGTRFRIRTGKALGRKRLEVLVRFRPVPRLPFGDDIPQPPANELRIGLDVDDPRNLEMHLSGTRAGSPPQLVPLTMTAELPTPELPEYSRVLLDILEGDSALSIRGDEAEQAWRIVTPVMEVWADGRVPMQEYPAGSSGPPPVAELR